VWIDMQQQVALYTLRCSLEMSSSCPWLQSYAGFLPSGSSITPKLGAGKEREIGYCSKCAPPPAIAIECQLPVWGLKVLCQP